MEASAPKRRKTSPTTSVSVHDPVEPASSDSAVRRSSRLNRSSSASPAQANLAQSPPDTRPPRNSPRGIQAYDNVQAPAASQPGSPASNHGSENNTGGTRLEGGSGSSRLSQTKDGGGNESATGLPPKSPARKVGGGLSIRPRRTSNKPSPRPLPPPSAEEEELIDPFKGRRLRRSPPRGVIPAVEPEEPAEPELPPTPTQKGLADPSSVVTSPMGIHNTPSKRPKRSRILAEKMSSSPLKRPPLRPPELGMGPFDQAAPPPPARDPFRDEPRRRLRKRKSHPGRQIEEADPLAAEKALRDSLLAEVAQLEADLGVVSRENGRLYHWQGSRRHAATELPDPEEQGRLLDALRRHALPPEEEAPPDPSPDWLAAAATNPIAFLPFGRADAAGIFASFVLPGSKKESEEESDDPPPPTSHHPVPMTADEELPYLQVFTPLTFTSTITTIPQDAGEDQDPAPLLQRHAISVASSPPGLFAAAIDMTVDTKTLSVAALAVPRLDPSAVSELGPFVERVLRGGGNSALTRNVGVVAWAMGEWVRLATRRARFWHAVERELGSGSGSAEGLVRCAKAMRRQNTTRRKRGRGYQDDDEERDGETGAATDKSARPSKADVIALLGRTSLDLDLSGVAGGDDDEEKALIARVQWLVEFDWTGEARSRIGLLLSAPAKWRASDEKGSLAGLPDMFDKLIQERNDPLEAVKIVVALIVGDGMS
ncbi:hypothetical protein F4802DRAFT_581876 [Xylaria palmicola]|nr:hypothetical protein F4802DRAFT_581876 [Xylaria palmicola]